MLFFHTILQEHQVHELHTSIIRAHHHMSKKFLHKFTENAQPQTTEKEK